MKAGLSLAATFLVVSFTFSFPAYGQQWTPEAQVKTRAVASPEISPDGKWVVYSVSEAVVTADKSEYVSQLWLASTDGKENRQLTFGEKSSTNPKWTPDGSAIAFTSNRRDNRNNLYLLRLSGGEAEPLTELKSGVSGFEISPDGKWIAFTMTDPKSDEEEKNDKARNDFRWVDENVKLARLYLIPIAKDASGKREPRKLTPADRQVAEFDWSPDSTTIAFSHVKSPVADYWPTADVSLVNVATGAVTPFASTEAAESSPMFSPDGKWIAALVSDLPVRWARSGNITLFPVGGGAPRKMPVSYDGQPIMLRWSEDGTKLWFYEGRSVGSALYHVNVPAGTIVQEDVNPSLINNVSMAKDAKMATMVIQTAEQPPEVYFVGTGDGGFVQLSRANAEAAKMPVGKTEVIRWKSTDGREIEGLLSYPVGYQPGKKVPLILNIHGGPAGVFAQNFVGSRGVYPLATMLARGFAILRPNPRGSSGYGTEFRRANFKDWGGKDYEDLMTGVDEVIKMGVADPERLGVMGWSYGGYMTSTIITKTKRFKAASAGAPVTNLMSFNGTADIPSFVPDYFGGEFWDDPATYAKHSAMFNIKGASTPTLIQHGDADVRVPISQGYELYNALRRQGVATRMIVLPRQPHSPAEPRMQIAAMQSNLDWFEKYLK